jgi:hypothetical protein
MSTHEQKAELFLAIDFDGTIVEHQFPRIGTILPDAKETINRLYEEGHKIIIWTCRNNTEPSHYPDPNWEQAPLTEVVNFLRRNGIKFHSINENHPDIGFWLESRKVFADVYIDDRNLGGFPGWRSAYDMIQRELIAKGHWNDVAMIWDRRVDGEPNIRYVTPLPHDYDGELQKLTNKQNPSNQ